MDSAILQMRFRKYIRPDFIFTIVLMFYASCVVAQPARPSVDGYVKELHSVSFTDNAESLTTANLLHNRINIRWEPAAAFRVRFEVRNRLYYGEQVRLVPGFGEQVDAHEGYVRGSRLWVDESSVVLHSVADRALLQWTGKQATVTAGRQRINWGINTVWNPNDLFNAYNFLDFDYEERAGTDGIRVEYFPGTNAVVEVAWQPSKERHQSIAAVKAGFNKGQYDWQVVAGLYRTDVVTGAGWAGPVGDAGFKGEVSWFRDKEDISDGPSALVASATVDYSISGQWYVSASGLYQSEPAPVLQSNAVFPGPRLSAKSLMPYRYTAYAGATYTVSPIVATSLSVIYGSEDHGLILFPTITWSAAPNLTIDLIAQSFFSETIAGYRTLGNSVYTSVKWNF